MILAENRVPFGAIYVPEEDFENNKSQVWFIATQLRYYLARITTAPFEVKINDNQNKIALVPISEGYELRGAYYEKKAIGFVPKTFYGEPIMVSRLN